MMRKIIVVVLFLLSQSACSAGGGIPQRPDALGLQTPEVNIPMPERWKLSNGLEVYYFHNEELPLMRARLYIEGGKLRTVGSTGESSTKGLAAAVGSQLREGGAGRFAADELDRYLDSLAASIESHMSDEYATVSLFCLSEDFNELFPVFGSVVRQPRFAQERLSLWKTLALESIRRRPDNPGTISSMVFTELLYGKGSMFASFSDVDSIQGITPALMRAYHNDTYIPQRGRLAISGSLPQAQVKQKVEEVFADWSAPKAVPALSTPKITAKPGAGIYLVERDLGQATIAIGHLGPKRHTEDFYDIRVFSEIFGSSGFSSTLFQEIRTKRGLAYSVWGGIFPAYVAGTFQVGLKTRKEQALEAVSAVLQLTTRVRKEAPAKSDFDEARQAVERSFVFKFAKPDSIVDRAVMLDSMGYPADFDQKYLERIAAVDADDVVSAAQRWIDPKEVIIVLVGSIAPEEVHARFPDMPLYRVEFDTAPGEPERLDF